MTTLVDLRRWTDRSQTRGEKIKRLSEAAALRVLLVGEERPRYTQLARLASGAPRRLTLGWCERLDGALPRLLAGGHDVVVLDCSTKAERARVLLRAARSAGCEAPIVTLVSSDAAASAVDGETLVGEGAADYLDIAGLSSALLERCLHYALERKQSQRELSRLAQHDLLTGLPNRMQFRVQLEQALRHAA